MAAGDTQGMLRKLLAFCLLLLFVITLGFATAVYIKQLLDEYFHRETVKVPDLVGRRVASALREIKETNGRLKLEIASEVESESVPRDNVISQDPPAGSEVNIEHTVYLTVSRGSRTREVPNLVGQPLRKARLVLSQSQLRLGSKAYVYEPAQERGTVVLQYPDAKAQVAVKQGVDVLVSDGPREPAAVALPRLSYLGIEKARQVLKDLGIASVKVEEVLAPEIPVGTVMDQDPPPGVPPRSDGTVTLTISRGNGIVTDDRRQLWIQFEMPPGLTDKLLEVDVTDTTTTTRVHSRTHPPGDLVRLEIGGRGPLEVKFFLDQGTEPCLVQRY